MKKYLNFINEIGHYPTPIKQIYNIIEEYCYEKLENYLDRKGKFANYSDIGHFTWKDINKQIIDEELFHKFPVEEIHVKFSIVVTKELANKQSYSSTYYDYNVDYDFKTELIKSQSKLAKKAISLYIDIGLSIRNDAKSIDIETFENYINTNLNHELTHAYQDYTEKTKGVKFTSIWDTMNQIAQEDWNMVNDSQTLVDFFWLIYKLSYPELNADIAAATIKMDGITDVIEIFEKFDPIKCYHNMIKELKENDYDIGDIHKNFGKYFVEMYKTAAKMEQIKPAPRVLKLENKDAKYVFNYWYRIFTHRINYIKHKLKLK